MDFTVVSNCQTYFWVIKWAIFCCAGSLVAEMKQNTCIMFGVLDKQQHWILPAQTLAMLETAIRVFHITIARINLE